MHLDIRESAAEGLEALGEFGVFNSAVAIQIEVFEDALAGLALIISTVSALTDFLEDSIANDLKTARVNLAGVSSEAPGVHNNLLEVGFTLSGENAVHERVVDAELFLSAVSITANGINSGAEISHDGGSLLLTGENARVLISAVSSLQSISGTGVSTTGDFAPSTLNDSQAGVAHVSAHGLDELIIGDNTILVVIEVVVEGAELLGGEEDTKAREHGLELKLVEHFVEVLVVGLKDVAKLSNVVNALGVKLELEFVDNLFKAVSPVSHLCYVKLG